jgi:hypothetical protein
MSPRLIIEQLARTKTDGSIEKLEFVEGVNAIVGPQNTGKSTWLRMLDFLMGDDGSPIAKFDEVLVTKYRAISALMRLGDTVVELERTWSEDGSRSQICLNGDRIKVDEIQNLFLNRLQIPPVRYPQGNIYVSDRTWPTLGWRSLLRHIYRRQDNWSELVHQQPESEQHACLLQFLGLAEHLFSPELSTLNDKRKRLASLETRRQHFTELLQKLVPDLMDDEELTKEVSPETIASAAGRIDDEITQLVAERETIVARVRDQSQPSSGRLNMMLEERAAALNARDTLRQQQSGILGRLNELHQYKTGLTRELDRLERTDAAAHILEDLKVTHCPACDQSVETRPRHSDSCFLCGQLTLDKESNGDAAARRLKFERDQIGAELTEAGELIAAAQQEQRQRTASISENERRLREVEQALRPFQASASAVIPEDLALLDQRIGTLHERRQTVEALRGPLEENTALNEEIAGLQEAIKDLEAMISQREAKVDFEKASDRIAEGFNTYLDAIRQNDPNTWTKTGSISAAVDERRTQLSISGRSARSQLGGTLTIYFLFAYHYTMLNLTRYEDCHYPGLAILDFYPDIAKESALGDRLYLVLAPFIGLSQDKEIEPVQVICTSRALPEKEHIHFIHLSETWR